MKDARHMVMILLIQRLSRKSSIFSREKLLIHGINVLVGTNYFVSMCSVIRSGNVNKMHSIDKRFKAPNQRLAPFRIIHRPEARREGLDGKSVDIITFSFEDPLLPYPAVLQTINAMAYEVGFKLLELNSQLPEEEFNERPWVLRLNDPVQLYPVEGCKRKDIKHGIGIKVTFARLCKQK